MPPRPVFYFGDVLDDENPLDDADLDNLFGPDPGKK
jgi:hypothetical protein